MPSYSSLLDAALPSDARVSSTKHACATGAAVGCVTALLFLFVHDGTASNYVEVAPPVMRAPPATAALPPRTTRPLAAAPAALLLAGAVQDSTISQRPAPSSVNDAPAAATWSMPSLLALPVLLLMTALALYRGRQTSARVMLPYSGLRSPMLPRPKTSRVVLHGKNKNDNFIDQTFTVIADQLLKFLPTTKREKKAFMYYRDGMSAQGTGDYAEALQNYYEALKLETDPFDRSYILYNIGLIHASNGELEKALEYYYQALERNPNMPSALNNIAVIYHFQGQSAEEEGRSEDAIEYYDKAADYWQEAIRLAPTNYMEAQNWLQSRGVLSSDRPY